MIDWSFVSSALARLAAQALPGRLLSVSLPLPRWPETRWLETSVAWQRPEHDLKLAGCGTAFVATSTGASRFTALHAAHRGLLQSWQCNDAEKPIAFTGFAFAPQGGAPLPNARLWVPELLLRRALGRITLICSTPAEQAATALVRWQENWHAWTQPAVLPAPTFSPKENVLADQAFLSRGRAALRTIAAGTLDKLVLTRSVALTADAAIPPLPLLDALAARHPNCATFGVGCDGRAFVGASPETLLALDGPHVRVDALAGTAWHKIGWHKIGDRPRFHGPRNRGLSPILFSDKNRREHDFVARAVVSALGELCNDILLPDTPEVMRLHGLTHLRRRVSARRGAEVSAFDLIARLHPTPAVGGAPTAAALDWLQRHGDPRDAWYTGGVGWLDARGDADIAVALRCGLIEADRISLYAGAGFVAGSDPEQELAETEAKLSAMREALRAGVKTTRRAA